MYNISLYNISLSCYSLSFVVKSVLFFKAKPLETTRNSIPCHLRVKITRRKPYTIPVQKKSNPSFLVKMSFICMRIKKIFMINDFALSPALKQRLRPARQQTIGEDSFVSYIVLLIVTYALFFAHIYLDQKTHKNHFDSKQSRISQTEVFELQSVTKLLSSVPVGNFRELFSLERTKQFTPLPSFFHSKLGYLLFSTGTLW